MEILVISSYPEKDIIHSSKTVGVGNYTKQTLEALKEAEITVYAEVLDRRESYIEKDIKVERFWRRGSLLSQLRLFSKASKSKADLIVIPFEMYMFGGMLSIIVFILSLAFLAITGKKIILILHQVLTKDLSAFYGKTLSAKILGIFIPAFYKLLLGFSHKVIVFEEILKSRLGGSSKVEVIPHAVLQEEIGDKEVARKSLGLDARVFYVFYFGYISPYKGVDLLLENWNVPANIKLIIGGGLNPNHKDKPEYKAYLSKIEKLAIEKGALVKGFIPEEKMPDYFAAIDLLILPYKTFMSSSGPLAQAFSYGKGTLLSEELLPYFESADMKKGLDDSGIEMHANIFNINESMSEKIQWAIANQEKLDTFSSIMKNKRSWGNIGQQYLNVLKGAVNE